jgi:arsenite methyltransferase
MARIVLLSTLGIACGGASSSSPAEPQHHHHHHFNDANASSKHLDDPARDEWQKPDEVVRVLELTPAMTVADVGAGTGYFSVRFARAVPQGQVIATDVEPDMVRFLGERAQREHLSNLRAVRSPANASGLERASADRIVVVDVWHHLDQRVAYARDLAAALRPGGKLFIVDFLREAKRGPPPEMRIAPEALIKELESADLMAKLVPVSLPDQYIIVAERRAETRNLQ